MRPQDRATLCDPWLCRGFVGTYSFSGSKERKFSLLLQCEQLPFALDALELVASVILEAQPGPEEQISDGAGHEHFTGRSDVESAGGQVDRDPGDIPSGELALACVDPGA